MAEYLNEAFVYKMKALTSCGTQYINYTKYKTIPTEELKPECMILETSQKNVLRNTFNSAELTEITNYAVVLANDPNPKYEEFKVNGKPVNINNIHEAISSIMSL